MTLLVPVAAAWALVALAPLCARVFGRFAGWPLAGGLALILAAVVSIRATQGEASASVPWIPAIDVSLRLRLDGLSMLFAVVVLAIGAIVLVYSTSYFRAPRSPGFYGLMTAFAAAMLTLVLADDLVVLFVAWELTTLCSYLLILRSSPEAKDAATRTLIVTAAGGLALLAAVATMIARTGTTELSAVLASDVWTTDPVFANVVAVLVALAAMTKSAQFPFQSWLPDAMVAPAPVSAYLHAAAMVKAGIFLLMLFAPATSNAVVWAPLLIAVGLTTALIGGAIALGRHDMKKLLAYSTVSQLGLLVAVIGIGTPAALAAASLHVIAHALFKSAGFMATGLVERRAGTRDLRELSRVWRGAPGDSLMVVLAATSMAGIPILVGFVSKELMIEAYLTAPFGPGVTALIVVALAASAVLTVAYSIRLARPFLPLPGRGKPTAVAAWRGSAAMSGTVGIVALAGLALGPAVGLLDALVAPAAGVAAGVAPADIYPLSLWHGVNAALGISLGAIALGIVVAFTPRLGPRPRGVPEIDGARIVQGALDGTIRLGRRVGDLTRFDTPAANLLVPIALIALAAVAVPFGWRGMPPAGDGFHAFDLFLGVMTAAGILAVAFIPSRVGAVISIGIAGFAVVLWFFVLGASDVALTQLLVEILTVVVMIMVLRRMPRRFPRERLGRRVGAGVLAIAAGVAATGATLVFTGHRDLSDAGAFFLREVEELTGGTNVVNTILVDFRALDTLGELVVLAIGAVAITALLDARRAMGPHIPSFGAPALADPHANAVFLRTLSRVLVPVLVIASAFALLRGHNDPGGGFIAALLGAAAIALVYLSAPTDDVPRIERPYLAIAGAGIVIAVVTGLAGFVDGSFLRPLHLYVFDVHLTSALVFDLGVYLAVFGVILAAVNRLGLSPRPPRDHAALTAPPAGPAAPSDRPTAEASAPDPSPESAPAEKEAAR